MPWTFGAFAVASLLAILALLTLALKSVIEWRASLSLKPLDPERLPDNTPLHQPTA
jgi:sulfate transport system permease protein